MFYQFKRNYGLIFKTFLYQVAMSLFGCMMYTSTSQIPLICVAGQMMITLFFLYIMSSQMFQAGSKACEYDRAHKLSSSPWLGFLFALIGFLPAILLSAANVIFPPVSASAVRGVPYVLFLINKIFLQGMYFGIFQWLSPTSNAFAELDQIAGMNGQPIYFLLFAIPGFLACGIGYLVGYLKFKKDRKEKLS